MPPIQGEWEVALKEEFNKDYYIKLYKKLVDEYAKYTVFPPKQEIFNAFHYAPLEKVKVVILGQDPYHDVGQAHGLCFSVKEGTKIPPSLENIYKELHDDVGCYIPNNGCLYKWASQGVFLLNAVLTVRAHNPQSHQGIGWEEFTDAAIKILNKQDRPIVFLLWGKSAINKRALLDNPKHLVLTASHPSPLSAYRGFFGCKHFSQTNEFLKTNSLEEIDWQIENIV